MIINPPGVSRVELNLIDLRNLLIFFGKIPEGARNETLNKLATMEEKRAVLESHSRLVQFVEAMQNKKVVGVDNGSGLTIPSKN